MEPKTNSSLTINDVLYSGDAGGIRQYRITETKQGIKIQIVNFSGYKQWYEGTNDSCTLEKIGGGDFHVSYTLT